MAMNRKGFMDRIKSGVKKDVKNVGVLAPLFTPGTVAREAGKHVGEKVGKVAGKVVKNKLDTIEKNYKNKNEDYLKNLKKGKI